MQTRYRDVGQVVILPLKKICW